MIKGKPWFVAMDGCRALDYYVRHHGAVEVSTALRMLDASEIGTYPIRTNSRNGGTRTQLVKIISESGLYKLVMRSDKPEAKAFQDWVTKVVLPSIRKNGGFS